MSKNKLTIIKNPRLYSNGGPTGLDLQGVGGGFPGFSTFMHNIDSHVQKIADIAKMFVPEQESPHLISKRAIRGYDLGGAMEVANTAASQVAQVVGDITAVNDTAKKVKEDVKNEDEKKTMGEN